MHTQVFGADGTRLALRVAGTQGAPAIVFVHGWAQSSAVWVSQFADYELTQRFQLVALDLRGHGGSGPADADRLEGYADSRVWADDLAAVLDFVGQPAVLVGWSYGGLVITDYLRHYGTAKVAGLVLVGAITELGRNRAGGWVGPAMRAALPAAFSPDVDEAVPALVELAKRMTLNPLPGALAQALISASLSVAPSVRAALFDRDIDSGQVLSQVDVPTLVAHGVADQVVDFRSAEYSRSRIPGAQLRPFDDAGHLPFVEDAIRFNAMLRAFGHATLSRK